MLFIPNSLGLLKHSQVAVGNYKMEQRIASTIAVEGDQLLQKLVEGDNLGEPLLSYLSEDIQNFNFADNKDRLHREVEEDH